MAAGGRRHGRVVAAGEGRCEAAGQHASVVAFRRHSGGVPAGLAWKFLAFTSPPKRYAEDDLLINLRGKMSFLRDPIKLWCTEIVGDVFWP